MIVSRKDAGKTWRLVVEESVMFSVESGRRFNGRTIFTKDKDTTIVRYFGCKGFEITVGLTLSFILRISWPLTI